MHRASVGKPAPDFTATAVMDGKLKGKFALEQPNHMIMLTATQKLV